MNGTLDKFLPPSQVKPKEDPQIIVIAKEKCAKCRKTIPLTEPKYNLKIKGKIGVYCQPCAKKILRPQENTEASL